MNLLAAAGKIAGPALFVMFLCLMATPDETASAFASGAPDGVPAIQRLVDEGGPPAASTADYVARETGARDLEAWAGGHEVVVVSSVAIVVVAVVLLILLI